MSSSEKNESQHPEAPKFSWAEYIKYRPLYPKSFYERIYAYHAEHSNKWDIAHDVATGPGVVAQDLGTRFGHVFVSDLDAASVGIARERLTNELGFPRSQFTFLREAAEKSSVEDGVVDLLVIAEAMHWTDIDAAMESFARQVKSGGTVAISLYGTRSLLFRDSRAQEALDKVYDVWTQRLIEMGGLASRTLAHSDSAYDTVPLSTEYWEPGAKRIFINTGGKKETLSMSVQNMRPFETRVGKEDVIETEQDDSWIYTKDLQWLKGLFNSVLPNIPEEEVEKFWAEADAAVGGFHKPVEIAYPIVQLLATRK